METALEGGEGEKFDAEKCLAKGGGGGVGSKVCRIFYLESV